MPKFRSIHRNKRQDSPTLPQPACKHQRTPLAPIPVNTISGKKIALARAAAADSRVTTASLPGTSSASSDHFHDTLLFKPSSLSKRIGVFSCCGSPLAVTVKPSIRRGLVAQVAICCKICDTSALVVDPYDDADLEMNGRSVLAIRSIGRGRGCWLLFVG